MDGFGMDFHAKKMHLGFILWVQRDQKRTLGRLDRRREESPSGKRSQEKREETGFERWFWDGSQTTQVGDGDREEAGVSYSSQVAGHTGKHGKEQGRQSKVYMKPAECSSGYGFITETQSGGPKSNQVGGGCNSLRSWGES